LKLAQKSQQKHDFDFVQSNFIQSREFEIAMKPSGFLLSTLLAIGITLPIAKIIIEQLPQSVDFISCTTSNDPPKKSSDGKNG
jgi:hypothetical protein